MLVNRCSIHGQEHHSNSSVSTALSRPVYSYGVLIPLFKLQARLPTWKGIY